MSTPPVREHQFKELDKFMMFAPAPGVDNKRARLVWSSYRGNPRMTVFTSVPNDSGKGVINAPMDPQTFFGFLHLLERMATGQNQTGPVEYQVDCDTLQRAAEGSGDKSRRILLSTVVFGRDDEGLIYIKVKADNRPEIRFNFRISDYHRFRRGDGTPFSEREASALQTVATVQALRHVFGHLSGELRPPMTAANGGTGTTASEARKPAARSSDFEDIGF